ncbi:hypothetical protein OHB12_23665 [Nocardia sp. NBC_01730]|uniref:hypothetical protein n=1 Tax=Nocardia sp. NBC_01730 TaxID=2975998 RepID=UPI002E109EA4|nr:hypothetical protein OHB12_23665 [Nocardia sp. NBC_01730]
MTPDEIPVLLQVAQSYDSRNIERLMQSAWLDAAQRANWNREEALIAVRAHYAESTERIMPGHVTARIRAARPAPGYAPMYQPAIAAAPPATEDQRAAARALFESNDRTHEPRKPATRRRRGVEPSTMRETAAESVRAFTADLGRILDGLRSNGDA